MRVSGQRAGADLPTWSWRKGGSIARRAGAEPVGRDMIVGVGVVGGGGERESRREARGERRPEGGRRRRRTTARRRKRAQPPPAHRPASEGRAWSLPPPLPVDRHRVDLHALPQSTSPTRALARPLTGSRAGPDRLGPRERAVWNPGTSVRCGSVDPLAVTAGPSAFAPQTRNCGTTFLSRAFAVRGSRFSLCRVAVTCVLPVPT